MSETTNKRVCDMCQILFNTGPFENMMGNGDLLYSRIQVWDKTVDLCPSCSEKLYKWLQNEGC